MLEIRKKERKTCLNRGFEQHNEKGVNDTRRSSFLLTIICVFENDIRLRREKSKRRKRERDVL